MKLESKILLSKMNQWENKCDMTALSLDGAVFLAG